MTFAEKGVWTDMDLGQVVAGSNPGRSDQSSDRHLYRGLPLNVSL